MPTTDVLDTSKVQKTVKHILLKSNFNENTIFLFFYVQLLDGLYVTKSTKSTPSIVTLLTDEMIKST